MAQHKEFNFRTPLVKMFSPKMIRSAAKHTGAVVRDRKISIVDLFWTLVSGFGAGKERTIRGCVRIIPLPPSQPTRSDYSQVPGNSDFCRPTISSPYTS